jgi:hypothetical protein
LDRIICNVIAGMQQAGTIVLEEGVGLCTLIIAETRRECQRSGLRISTRQLTDRVDAIVFGGISVAAVSD